MKKQKEKNMLMQKPPPSISVLQLKPLENGKRMDLSNVSEHKIMVIDDMISPLSKVKLTELLPRKEKLELKKIMEEGKSSDIVEFLKQNKETTLSDRKNILNPFIRPAKWLKMLEVELTSKGKVSFHSLKDPLVEISKRLSLPTKIDYADLGTTCLSGFSVASELNSLYSNKIECLPKKKSLEISLPSFTFFHVKQMGEENTFEKLKKEKKNKKFQEKKEELKKKTNRNKKYKTKKVEEEKKYICDFPVEDVFKKEKVIRKCGNVVVGREGWCDKHGEDIVSNDELYPYTCDFIINRGDKYGFRCDKLIEEGETRCKLHMKSSSKEEKKQNPLIRTIKVRCRPTKQQKKKLEEFFGGCRKTYNNLVEVQEEIKDDDFNILALKYVSEKNLSDDMKYLINTPKDCRSFAVREFVTGRNNALDKYEDKLIWNEINGKKEEVTKPEMKYKTKRECQSMEIPKTFTTLNKDSIKVYKELGTIKLHRQVWRVNKRGKRKGHLNNLHYEKVFNEGLKCDIKILKTKTSKYYFAIPHRIPVRKTEKKYTVGSADPGVKTFLTTFNTDGECISFGSEADKNTNIYFDKIRMYKWIRKHKPSPYLTRKIQLLYEKLRNKVKDLHYKTIRYVVQHEKFYLPKFNSKQMGEEKGNGRTKQQMNILSHFKFSQLLITKAKEVCCEVNISDEFRTTKTCGKCLKMNHRVGADRVFTCPYCSYTTGRDINASRNNLLKYISG